MKLESAAMHGKDVLKLEPVVKGDVLETTPMVREVFRNKEKCSGNDLAYSAHVYLAGGLASLALNKAVECGIKTIGFSGGVACNEIIAKSMRRIVESQGLRFVVHEAVPPGDGGLSFGQAVASGFFRF